MMRSERKDGRILIYAHDTFGLGHLRRCRAIAHSLVENFKHLSVLILSGSPIIGSFDFRSRVDFVRIPGVIKLRNGEYTSLNLHLDIEQTLSMRASIIKHTADIFDPDVFIADKETAGARCGRARQSSSTRGTSSPPTCSSWTRSPWGCAARCSRHSRCSSRGEPGWCSACGTSWTNRGCWCPNGSARMCCRRCETSMTRSGST